MFNGKLKAVTFSYDDGTTQDFRLTELLKRYNLKATFNLNSELLGQTGTVNHSGLIVCHNKVRPDEVAELYKGFEVAVHTLTHPCLPALEKDEIIRQVEQDRLNLEDLTGSEVVGMAYPCGGVNNDDRVAQILRENTAIRYSRTIKSTYSFDLQENLLRFNPTTHHLDKDKLFELGREFISLHPDTPKLFYIWGHSFELDVPGRWEMLEKFLELISGHDDIFYGTNREVFGI